MRTLEGPCDPLTVFKTVELELAPAGPLEDYDNLFCQLALAGPSFLAVQKKLRGVFQAIASPPS